MTTLVASDNSKQQGQVCNEDNIVIALDQNIERSYVSGIIGVIGHKSGCVPFFRDQYVCSLASRE